MSIRTILVDDEKLAIQGLQLRLEKFPDVEIIDTCSNGREAIRKIKTEKPDLVFLDIQMPKLDGFEVVELAGARTEYLFVTAYDQFALRAFEVHAIDYLLKPFSGERLAQALAHARERVTRPPAREGTREPALEAVVQAARQRQAPLERILIRDGARVQVVPVATIDYIEAQDDYVAVVAAGRQWLKSQRLAELETQLDPQAFLRVHRSYIVNVAAIARIEPAGRDGHCAVLQSGARVPISRSGYARVRELIK